MAGGNGRYLLGRRWSAAADYFPRTLLDDCQYSRQPAGGDHSGIGLFIGMMGLKNAGVIVANKRRW